MSAGTVVIAGGILATVILLTIVAVLCLCRLQVWQFLPFRLARLERDISLSNMSVHRFIKSL